MALTLPQISLIMEEFPLPEGVSWYPKGASFFAAYGMGADHYRGDAIAYLSREVKPNSWKFSEIRFNPTFDSAEDMKAKIRKGAEALAG